MKNNRPLGWTTLEEAKLLVEAGLDPNTSDLCYCYDYDKSDFKLTIVGFANVIIPRYSYNNSVYERKIPCWSLGALIELIPKLVGERNSSLLYDAYFNFELSPRYRYPLRWVARYSGSIKQKDNEVDFDGQTMFSKDVSIEFTYETAIETICDTTIWLLENGYIEKHEEHGG